MASCRPQHRSSVTTAPEGSDDRERKGRSAHDEAAEPSGREKQNEERSHWLWFSALPRAPQRADPTATRAHPKRKQAADCECRSVEQRSWSFISCAPARRASCANLWHWQIARAPVIPLRSLWRRHEAPAAALSTRRCAAAAGRSAADVEHEAVRNDRRQRRARHRQHGACAKTSTVTRLTPFGMSS